MPHVQSGVTVTVTPASTDIFLADSGRLEPNYVSFSDDHLTTSKNLIDFTTRSAWCNKKTQSCLQHLPPTSTVQRVFHNQQMKNHYSSILDGSKTALHTEDSLLASAIGILRKYYEGPPLFYAAEQRTPRIFKPVLLYHSELDNNSKRDVVFTDPFCERSGNILEDDQSQLEQQRNSESRYQNKPREAPEVLVDPLTVIEQSDTEERVMSKPLSDSMRQTSEMEMVKNFSDVSSSSCATGDKPAESEIFNKKAIPEPENSYPGLTQEAEMGNRKSAFRKPVHYASRDIDFIYTSLQYASKALQDVATAHITGSEGCPLDRNRNCFELQQDGGPDNLIGGFHGTTHHGLKMQSAEHSFMPSHSVTSRFSGINDFCAQRGTLDNLHEHRFGECRRESPKGCLHNNVSSSLAPQQQLNDNLGSWQPTFAPGYGVWGNDVSSPLGGPSYAENAGNSPGCFKCQFCDTVYNTAIRLRNHLKVHSADKPYTCECGRAFARNEELTRHRRIHSGQRPFRCHLCGKTFGRKDHLNKHRTTHLHTSEKKMHQCEVAGCLQRYTRSDALARHQWAAHGIKARSSKWRPQPVQ